jgi:hypothetical protein
VQNVIDDIQFRQARPPRQLLDGAAIGVARGKIHLGKRAGLAQPSVDQADALDKVIPVDG